MESHLLGLYPKDLGMTWMDWEALMGAPQGVWPATLGAPPWSPSCSLVSLLGPCGRTSFMCILGFFVKLPYPLGISYK